MALTQTHFRFRTDANAVDATPTWAADEDASPSPATTPFRLRLGVQGTSAASGEFEIYAQKNSGSYAAITTSATGGVQSYDASSSADDTALLVPRLTLSSAWWLAGASIDLDFAGNQVYPSGSFTDYLSCSRASDGWAQNSAGTWIQFTSNQLRITDRGLLSEATRTNNLINSDTPVTQTTASLGTGDYTLWVNGTGSALASGGTATITGAASATDGAPNTFTVTVAGTVVVTVTGTLTRFQLEQGTFPSSYIPTGATTAVRAADVITFIGDADTLLNGAAASAVDLVDLQQPSVGGNVGFCPFLALTGASYRPMQVSNADNTVNSVVIGSIGTTLGNSLTYASDVKVGGSWNASGRTVVGGGGDVATDPNGMTTGTWAMGVSNAGWGYCYFKRATFWNSRLADATLQALTAP